MVALQVELKKLKGKKLYNLNPKVVSVLKKLQDELDKQEKLEEFEKQKAIKESSKKAEKLANKMKATAEEIEGETKTPAFNMDIKNKPDCLTQSKLELKDLQEFVLKNILTTTSNGYLVAHGTGCGKSVIASFTAKCFLDKFGTDDAHVVFFSPAGLIANIKGNFRKYGMTDKFIKENFTTISTTKAGKDFKKNMKIIEKYKGETIEYQLSWTNENILHTADLNKIEKSNILVIIDEVHTIRNADSLASKAIQNYCFYNSAFTLCLTATPYVNGASDYYPIINLVHNSYVIGLESSEPSEIVQKTAFSLIKKLKRNYLDTYYINPVKALIDVDETNFRSVINYFDSLVYRFDVSEIINSIKEKETAELMFKLLTFYVDTDSSTFKTSTLKTLEYYHKTRPYLLNSTLTQCKSELGKVKQLSAFMKGRLNYVSNCYDANFPESFQYTKVIVMSEDYENKFLTIQAELKANKKDSFLSGSQQLQNLIGDDEVGEKIDIAIKISESGKTIIYSKFIKSGIDVLKKILNKKKVKFVEITGKVSQKNRIKNLEMYNSGKVNLMLISDSGGTGIDTKGTKNIILITPNWNDASFQQVKGRAIRYKSHAHLPIKERFVNIYELLLITKNDDKIWKQAEKDKDFMYHTSLFQSSDAKLYAIMKDKKQKGLIIEKMMVEIQNEPIEKLIEVKLDLISMVKQMVASSKSRWTEHMLSLYDSYNLNVATDTFDFYQTPENLTKLVYNDLSPYIIDKNATILEPTVGLGDLIAPFIDATYKNIYTNEFNPDFSSLIRQSALGDLTTFTESDYLQTKFEKKDFIIMNPPFRVSKYRFGWKLFTLKAIHDLKPGGMAEFIVPSNSSEWIYELRKREIEAISNDPNLPLFRDILKQNTFYDEDNDNYQIIGNFELVINTRFEYRKFVDLNASKSKVGTRVYRYYKPINNMINDDYFYKTRPNQKYQVDNRSEEKVLVVNYKKVRHHHTKEGRVAYLDPKKKTKLSDNEFKSILIEKQIPMKI